MILVSAPTGWGDSRFFDLCLTILESDSEIVKGEYIIVTEFIKQRFNRGFSHNLFFWRDNVGHEVDIIENQQ